MTNVSAETGNLEVVEKPLLIYKAGALGDTPLDFYRQLADEYEAAYVSSDEIRRDLMAGGITGVGAPRNPKSIMRSIRSIGRERTRNALEEGDDVVLDMFVNSPRTRYELTRLAHSSGALTVAVVAHTPFEVAIGRVREWTRNDAFVIPVADWDIPPEQAARTMMKGFQPLDPDEEIDYTVNLTGIMSTDQLVEHFDQHLVALGLDQAE